MPDRYPNRQKLRLAVAGRHIDDKFREFPAVEFPPQFIEQFQMAGWLPETFGEFLGKSCWRDV